VHSSREPFQCFKVTRRKSDFQTWPVPKKSRKLAAKKWRSEAGFALLWNATRGPAQILADWDQTRGGEGGQGRQGHPKKPCLGRVIQRAINTAIDEFTNEKKRSEKGKKGLRKQLSISLKRSMMKKSEPFVCE